MDFRFLRFPRFPRPMLNSPVKNDVVGSQFLGKVLGRLARFREPLRPFGTVPADSSPTEQSGQNSPDSFLDDPVTFVLIDDPN
jgi:hypothetical protein